MSTETEEEEDSTQTKWNRERDEVIAYLIGPRKDGLILNKDETILDLNERFLKTEKKVTTLTTMRETGTRLDELPDTDQAPLRPHWTGQLIAFQRSQLRKGHNMRRQKIAMKLMRQIRKQPNDVKEKENIKRTFNTKRSLPLVLKQCMNTVRLSKPMKYKRSPVKTSPSNNLHKRSKHSFSPITIPGTSDAPVKTSPILGSG